MDEFSSRIEQAELLRRATEALASIAISLEKLTNPLVEVQITKPPEGELDEVPAPEVIESFLLLVLDEFSAKMPTIVEISHWPDDVKRDVVEWASAIHLTASDNYGIVIPETPAVLTESEAAKSKTDD